MQALGFDIGTSTISAVRIDARTGGLSQSLCVPNDCGVDAQPWARAQDPEAIWRKVSGILDGLLTADVRAIGLTGQMHGMLYTDVRGNAVSPFFTWQDGRGDLPMADGRSYAAALSEATGMPLATGHGAVTHFYHRENGLVPRRAAFVCAIADYIGMRMTGREEPLTHRSNAASFGATDWDGIKPLLRETDKTEALGVTPQGVPVVVAIGDNQASFIGSVRDPQSAVLVNMGTGGQVSLATGAVTAPAGCELRPLVDGGHLLNYSSLCGGAAYALLERLFREIALLAGAPDVSLYGAMNSLADRALDDPIKMRTLFCGTRENPALRGSIENLSADNFTAAHLVQGTIAGMVQELFASYQRMLAAANKKPAALVGSGNAIRKNPALRRAFEAAFGLPMQVPAHEEEAAYGAALFALAASGVYPSVHSAQSLIAYAKT